MRLFAFSLLSIFASMLRASPVHTNARDDGFRISKRHPWKRITQQLPTNLFHRTQGAPPTYEEATCTPGSVEKAWINGRGGLIHYGTIRYMYELTDRFYDRIAVISTFHVDSRDKTQLDHVLERILVLDRVHHLIAWGRYDGKSGTDFLIVTKKMGDPAPETLSRLQQEQLRDEAIKQYKEAYRLKFTNNDMFHENSYFAFAHIPGHSPNAKNGYTAHPIHLGNAEYVEEPKPEISVLRQRICEPIRT